MGGNVRLRADAAVTLEGEAIDSALAAMGDFADLAFRYLVGHSAGVAELAAAAAQQCGFEAADLVNIRRAALVHDVGRGEWRLSVGHQWDSQMAIDIRPHGRVALKVR